ncbi:hypothetical protein CXG81DRAFT_17358 [Caulochytrium protostelioides]|uniref:Uncharacterized protein n=1 Tax=Caulochytrium protostelioides TaxID=1555241 RepID=A0A4P9WYR3_9FUNG|nr:hypothetical protein CAUPRSCDRAFT_11640 [Caulochytrium protostelioides]RKP03000.1 hypothetical protein CXG81DRAFT_17358 [Caulochytrium protostelioides]|eukprot:RKP03000.1 hypothetical protein CXG81DRAFT_17358 [Caulochytrium protostelioides]
MLLFSVRFSGILLALLVSAACHIAGYPMDSLKPHIKKLFPLKMGQTPSPLVSGHGTPNGGPPIYPWNGLASLPELPSSAAGLGDAESILPTHDDGFMLGSKKLNSDDAKKVHEQCATVLGPDLSNLNVFLLAKAMVDAASASKNWPKLFVIRDYVASHKSVDLHHKIVVIHAIDLAAARGYLDAKMEKNWIDRSLSEWSELFSTLKEDRPFRQELDTAMSFLSDLQSVDVRFPLLFLDRVSYPKHLGTTADEATAAAVWLRYLGDQAKSDKKAQAIDEFNNEIIRISQQFKLGTMSSKPVSRLEWPEFAHLFTEYISRAKLPMLRRPQVPVTWPDAIVIMGDTGLQNVAVLRNYLMIAHPTKYAQTYRRMKSRPNASFIPPVPSEQLDEYAEMQEKIATIIGS